MVILGILSDKNGVQKARSQHLDVDTTIYLGHVGCFLDLPTFQELIFLIHATLWMTLCYQ